jgi:hypothetical protein
MTVRDSRKTFPHMNERERRIPEESLASLRAYRQKRVADRMLPHQPKAA